MHSYEELSLKFTRHFSVDHFPAQPATLYNPNRYFLQMGGKRIRPVLCLMGNELFDDISADAWHVATAMELFHNFTLIHDDIMDKASLRRGMETVHKKYGDSTALLAGDVMLVAAYDALNRILPRHTHKIIQLFNNTAREVCEGQQLDMDFEKKTSVSFQEYMHMISLKTSVLLAASLKMGAILGGALERNQNLIYEFGKKLGLAFQVQDDFLDAFGSPDKVGKETGGDIRSGKKTFLLIYALETLPADKKEELQQLLQGNDENKVQRVLSILKQSKVDEWAQELREKFTTEAFQHLDDVAVISKRKEPLRRLAMYLTNRDH